MPALLPQVHQIATQKKKKWHWRSENNTTKLLKKKTETESEMFVQGSIFEAGHKHIKFLIQQLTRPHVSIASSYMS